MLVWFGVSGLVQEKVEGDAKVTIRVGIYCLQEREGTEKSPSLVVII